MRGAQGSAQLLLERGGKILPHEIPIDLSGNELGRDRTFHDHVDHGDAIEPAGLAQKGLLAIVVLVFVDHEFCVDVIPPVKARAASRMSFSV